VISEALQLREKVPQDGIAFHDCRVAHGRASPIDAPGRLVGQDRRRRKHRRRPVRIDEPADRRHVPDFLRPADMVVRIFLEARGEKLADLAIRLDPAFDFGDRAVQVGRDAHARDQDERRAAVEENLRAAHVLPQVEFARVRPFESVTAKPDDDDLVGDVGGSDKGGGDIRDRGDGDDAEWVVRTARPRAGDQVVDRFGAA
jgi:hypothetical protein